MKLYSETKVRHTQDFKLRMNEGTSQTLALGAGGSVPRQPSPAYLLPLGLLPGQGLGGRRTCCAASGLMGHSCSLPAFPASGVCFSPCIPSFLSPPSSPLHSVLPVLSPSWLLTAELCCLQRNPVSLVQGLICCFQRSSLWVGNLASLLRSSPGHPS